MSSKYDRIVIVICSICNFKNTTILIILQRSMNLITIEIPGHGDIKAENLVMDYNGTVAKDGRVIDGVRERLNTLSRDLNIYILTADTFGTVYSEFENQNVEIKVMDSDNSAINKKKYVEALGIKNSICIGNGYNDIEMMKSAVLAIGVAQAEGINGKLVIYSDIVFTSILDALDSIINHRRIKATMRG